MTDVAVSLANLEKFIKKMQQYCDPGQPVCSDSTGSDYYQEDAVKDFEIVMAAFGENKEVRA